MEEVEFLCNRCGNGKPGRIGMMETGKLIELGLLRDFREHYGKAIQCGLGRGVVNTGVEYAD